MRLLLAAALVTMGFSGSAAAATCYVANSCSGQPTPCSTNLQNTLDDTNCTLIELVGNSTFTGDFRINRGIWLDGNGTATLIHKAGSDYGLRIEETSFVAVYNLTLNGTLAVYGSTNVVLDDLTIDSTGIGIQLKDSDDVDITDSFIDGATRGVDARDTTYVTIGNTIMDGVDYGVVLSDGDVSIDYCDVEGNDNAFVVQDGGLTGYPALTVSNSTYTTVGSGADLWKWSRASTTFTNSGTPSTTSQTHGSLVSLIGYTPWGGP